ncbi:MAG: hypothetical protein DRN15_09160 [Thermoprotei archaeon]|nr:MAG: hypothetical protein DRN15_09160 [Thermoprotei archaeon]RLF24818.1 MAG: hypothetical protein DRM97_02950 [Thermoprotei archaeon]
MKNSFTCPARYDSLVKAITVAYLLLIALVATILLVVRAPFYVVVITLVIFTAMAIAAFALSPRAFVLSEEGLLICLNVKKICLKYQDIVSARYAPQAWSWVKIRLCGSGGLFGFYGLFLLKNLGRAWLFVTNRRNIILVETRSGKKFLISPEDPRKFMIELMKRMKELNR